MTDTTVTADTGGAPDTSAPAATEVPINPSPVSAPSPLGPQAPQAPQTSRDARAIIEDAYNRALNPPKPQRPAPKEPAKEAPKAAEAKPGHNKPPEKTDADKPLNLKQRPGDQPLPQPRDRGRFAPRQETTADKSLLPAVEGDGAPASPPAPSPTPLPHDAPFREPPPRTSEAARLDWANTPETVRGDVHRMHKEFSQAYEQYRGAAEAFAPIAHFHQMAQQHGTTLAQALDNYTSMEQKLRADPVAGLDLIIHNLGLKTPDGEPIGFRDIAYHVLTQTPDQLRTLQQGNTVNAAQHQIGELHQRVAHLTNALQQMQYNQQYSYTHSAIDAFADDGRHPRFDELATIIDQELKGGYDLETAYRRAELLNPTTQAAQTRTTSAQTRPPDRSISGAPGGSASANGTTPAKRGERSLRDTIEHNARRVSNGY